MRMTATMREREEQLLFIIEQNHKTSQEYLQRITTTGTCEGPFSAISNTVNSEMKGPNPQNCPACKFYTFCPLIDMEADEKDGRKDT
jgi:hypothetical protein